MAEDAASELIRDDVSAIRAFLQEFAQNLIDQHPLGKHKDGSTRYLIKCPSQVLGESILSALPPKD